MGWQAVRAVFLMALGDVGLGGFLRLVMLVLRLFEATGFVQAWHRSVVLRSKCGQEKPAGQTVHFL